MTTYSDKNIIDAWHKNAKPWVNAIRDNEIESSSLITNKAIIDAVIQKSPATVLDIGCGEGWLARELHSKGVSTLGVDVIPELIASAEHQGGGEFELMSYEELSAGAVKETFDVITCNFSLLGNESVSSLFQQVPSMLSHGGCFIVQTIHPVSGCGEEEYKDGWREGSWAGFSEDFTDPAPWYFRTFESWKELFSHNGFSLSEIIEPLNPKTQKPASVIFIGESLN